MKRKKNEYYDIEEVFARQDWEGKKNEPFSSQKRREIDGRSEETDQTLVISIYVLHPGHP